MHFRGLVGKYVRDLSTPLSARPRETETSGIWPFRELPVKPERHGARAGEHRQHLGQKKLPEPATKEGGEFTSTCSRPRLEVSKSDNILYLTCYDICLAVIGFLKKEKQSKDSL